MGVVKKKAQSFKKRIKTATKNRNWLEHSHLGRADGRKKEK